MRVLSGQVHIAEVVLVILFSLLCFLIGTSLPLVAAIGLLFWPLMLIQMVFDGVGIWIGTKLFKRRTAGQPAPRKRSGVARCLWVFPLAALTAGYAVYVLQNGKWFL